MACITHIGGNVQVRVHFERPENHKSFMIIAGLFGPGTNAYMDGSVFWLNCDVSDETLEEGGAALISAATRAVRDLEDVAALFIPTYRPCLRISSVTDSTGKQYAERSASCRVSVDPPFLVDLDYSSDAVAAVAAATSRQRNPGLSRLLDLLFRPTFANDVWYNLWGVYDIIRYDLRPEWINRRNTWIDAHATVQEQNDFSDSANCFEYSGELARHQKQNYSPHEGSNKITPEQAQAWLIRLTRVLLFELTGHAIELARPRSTSAGGEL